MEENSTTLDLKQTKKDIQRTLNLFDLKIIRNPLKKSVMHSQLLHKGLVKNFDHLGVPMHVLVLMRLIEDLNYDNLVHCMASHLAEEFGTDTPHIVKCLQRLEKKGFVIRLWDPSNPKRRIKLWMMNPTVVYRGSGMDYQRALDNYQALADRRYEDTYFDRDRSDSGMISNLVPWVQGRLNLEKEQKFDDKSEETKQKTGS